MYKSDKEMFYRMALSRLELVFKEIVFIRNSVFDSSNMAEAELALGEAIEFLAEGRDEAAKYFGFEVRRSMGT